MAGGSIKLAVAVAFTAVLYQFWAKHFVFAILGVGRIVQPIEDFPFICRRIVSEQLEGCEDVWLDEEGRVLYAACSGSVARSQWNQGMSKFNISGRRPQGSELIAIYIDEPRHDGFRSQKLAPEGYSGAAGDGTLDLIGFDVQKISSSTLRFWLINQRPPVDTGGKYLDATRVGDNVTVDVFDYVRDSKVIKHVKTVSDKHIYSGNGLAVVGDDEFVISNDHSGKIGIRKELDLIIGGGGITHCNSISCRFSTASNLKFTNGIIRGADDLIYAPFAAEAFIGVYRLDSMGLLSEIDRIDIGMPVDNLSVDANGDIWAAGLTKLLEIMAAVADPLNEVATSTVWRIRARRGASGGYEVTKALEDGEKKILSMVSTAVHDVRTGRLFLGSVAMPFLMVCDPK
ncbi:hypothetical protein B0J11DRAFT_590347 [Dendryphion nanum]|uniref:Uncharacterized protein n=1 Tax=Dendryphion nanum TaxID=256645 RepID=A0A9P9DLA4_9PLEO|nr:hypothetical protein B0J11DRAFT_590347 [Dendryphion nanum]